MLSIINLVYGISKRNARMPKFGELYIFDIIKCAVCNDEIRSDDLEVHPVININLQERLFFKWRLL